MKRAPCVLLVALWTASGCSVAPEDLTGKNCPCVEGWHCVDGVCLAGDADAGVGCGEDGRYPVRGFAPGWHTQNALQWTWETPSGVDGEDLLHANIVLGTDEAKVDRCACALGRGERCDEGPELRVVDESDNPELARDTRSNRTGSEENVRSTVTSGLQPDTVYAAALVAFDRMGGSSRTSIALNRTGRTAERTLSVFDDGTLEAGYPIPSCFEAGAEGFTYQVQCPPPAEERGECKIDADPCPEGSRWPGSADDWLCESDIHPAHQPFCWVTLRWQELDLPIESLNEGAFADAYVEIDATLGGEPSNYGEAFLVLENASGQRTIWGFRGELALRGGDDRHTYQVPLLGLTLSDGTPMTWSDLPGMRIYRASVGGLFTHGQSVTVHSLAIRY